MKSTFRRNYNSLGFRAPRWQPVHQSVYNSAKWARYKMTKFHQLISRLKKK